MSRHPLPALGLLALSLASSSCNTERLHHWPGEARPLVQSRTDLELGQLVAQGMVGVSLYDQLERSGGTNPPSGPQPDDLETMITIAGAWQETLGDAWFDWGLEGGGALGYRTANGVVDSGGNAVDVDVDLSLFDLYGGLFVSRHLGHRARLLAGAGPVVQFANWSQDGFDVATQTQLDQHGNGLGLGYYGRAGIEFETQSDLMLGLVVRWIDSEVSIDDGLGKLDLRGVQVMVTFSRSY